VIELLQSRRSALEIDTRHTNVTEKPFSLLVVLFRSVPPFPLYSTAGPVDGGEGACWGGSGADCSAGGARAGASLPQVLSTRVFIFFRPRGVEGRSGGSGTRSTSFSDVAALALLLLAILSASSRSLSLL
jgi:hypothetical protein